MRRLKYSLLVSLLLLSSSIPPPSLFLSVSLVYISYPEILYSPIGMQRHSRSPLNKGPSSNHARRTGVYFKIILHRIGAIYSMKNDGEPVCKRAKRKRADVEKKNTQTKNNNSLGVCETSDGVGIRRRL